MPAHFRCKLCGKLVIGKNTFQQYCEECKPIADLINRNKMWLRRDMKNLIEKQPNVAFGMVVDMMNDEGLKGALEIIGDENFLKAYSYMGDGLRWMGL